MILYCFVILIFVILLFIGFFIWIHREPKSWNKTKNNKLKGGDIGEIINALQILSGSTTPTNPNTTIAEAHASIYNLENIQFHIICPLCDFLIRTIQDNDKIDASEKKNLFVTVISYIKYLCRESINMRTGEVIPSEYFTVLFAAYMDKIYNPMETNEKKVNTLYIFLTDVYDLVNIFKHEEVLPAIMTALSEYITDVNVFTALLKLCLYAPDLQPSLSKVLLADNMSAYISNLAKSNIDADLINKLSSCVDYRVTFESANINEWMPELMTIIDHVYAAANATALLKSARDLVIRVRDAINQAIPIDIYTDMSISDMINTVCEEGSGYRAFVTGILTTLIYGAETYGAEVNRLETIVDYLSSILDIMRDDYVKLVPDPPVAVQTPQ